MLAAVLPPGLSLFQRPTMVPPLARLPTQRPISMVIPLQLQLLRLQVDHLHLQIKNFYNNGKTILGVPYFSDYPNTLT